MEPTLSNSNRSRFGWIDHAKGFAIIFVVYRHVLGGLSTEGIEIPYWVDVIQQSVFNIRMPLFFIIAGLFARKSIQKRSIGNLFQYKSNTILYPYFVWGTIQISFQVFFSGYSHSQKSLSDLLYLLYNPFLLQDQFWFLYVIFFISVLFAFITYYLKLSPLHQLLLGIILNMASIYVNFTPAKAILEFYLFFAVGDFISKILLNNQHKLSSIKSLCFFLPIFIATQWYWVSNPNLKESQIIVYNLIAITGGAFIFLLALLLDKTNSLQWLKTIGKHSLYIYIMHVIIQAGLRAIIVNMLQISNLSIILPLTLVFSIILPIYIYKITIFQGMWYLYNFKKPNTITRPSVIVSRPTT